MRRSFLLLAVLAAPLGAQVPQSADRATVATSAVRDNWRQIHGFIVRSAEQLPDSLLEFRPTPAVRTFAQLFAHVAGAENMFCSIAMGERMRAEDEFEKPGVTKAQLIAALKASGEYCERAYALSDADAAAMVDLFGQKRSRLFTLAMNATHDGEHYGNLITYLRINGMVPPSSQR